MTTATDRHSVPRAFFASVRGKLTVFVTLLVALVTVSLTLAGYSYVRDMLRDELREELGLRGAGLREVMLSYVSQQHERVSLVASRTRLRQLLSAHLDGKVEPELFVSQTRRILLDARQSTRDFLDIRIAGLDGRIVTATDGASLGRDVSRDPAYLEGRAMATLGLPKPMETGHQAMLSAPARTNEGRELGVVMVELDVRPMLGLLEAIRGGHETARVRLATRLGERIRYIFPIPADPPILEVDAAADTAMAHALAGETGFLDTHPFRGRDVVAAYRPTGHRDWALVTQVDAAEAYAPVERLYRLAWIASLLVLGIAAYGAFRIATGFTRPLRSLSRAAKAIEGGDLDVSARVISRDEVGDLSLAFDHMAEGLKRHRDHLEDLVRERTNDLEARGEELEHSRDQLEALVHLLEHQADVAQRDLHRAEIIQRSLLPHSPPPLPDFTVQTLYRPGHSVGGDLYDVVGVGDRHVVLVIADASGHGVSAAMLSVLFKHRLRVVDEASGRPCRPAEALRALNTSLRGDITAPGLFITAAYCLLDTESRELVVSSAGHPPLLWLRANGETRNIDATGPALGLYADAAFTEHRCCLGRGDQMLLYTDGLLDPEREHPSGPEQIADALRSLQGDRAPLRKLFGELAHGVSWEDRDDATIVLLEARPGESSFDEPARDESLTRSPASPLKLTYAELDEATLIAARGPATWSHAETFFEAAEAVLEENRSLIVDLSGCEYLDSTFLGTLFQVASEAEVASVPLRIQGVLPSVRAWLEELSMHSVLALVTEEAVKLPRDMQKLTEARSDRTHERLRLLRAHELLARLSDANREKFQEVVDTLRSEIGKTGPGRRSDRKSRTKSSGAG